RPAIAVVIEDGDAETLRSVIKKVRLLSGVFKLSIAQVMPKARARSLVRFRRAVGFMGAIEGAEQITLDRPLHIIGDHQIEFAVAVVIHPGSTGGKFIRTPKAGCLGYVAECAVAVVVKQMTLPKRGNKNVVVSVIVIIANCYP